MKYLKVLQTTLTSHSHDPYNLYAESPLLVVYVLHGKLINSLKYPHNWMTAAQFSIINMIAN